jgi:hypothetical protein
MLLYIAGQFPFPVQLHTRLTPLPSLATLLTLQDYA